MSSSTEASVVQGRAGEQAVALSGVRKHFGDVCVLEDLSLDVTEGDKVAIIGPSGSGKTTILRIIAGLEPPSGGSVVVFGRSVWHAERRGRTVLAPRKHVRAATRDVGMVFQHFHLFPHMTALGNVIEGPLRVLGLSRREAGERGDDLLSMVGLEGYGEAYPSQLSGGQQQRVAIARTLAMRPRVMLFDEVTSALDPELVGEVLAVIKRLAEEFPITMMLVTHEMSFAAQIATRVVVLDGGQIIEEGLPADIFRRPRAERTRRFLSAVMDPLGSAVSVTSAPGEPG